MVMRNFQEQLDVDPEKDIIDPQRRGRIEAGDIPIEELMPRLSETEKTYLETIASEEYNNTVKKVEDLTGIEVSHRNMPQLMHLGMQNVQEIQQIETQHKDFLQNLAIQAVFSLPEFEPLKEAYNAGEIKINVELTEDISQEDLESYHEEEDQESGLTQAEEMNMDLFDQLKDLDIDREIVKRKFANMMIQGAAVSYTDLYHLVSDSLEEIDPDLVHKYGVFFYIGNLLNWLKPEEALGIPMGVSSIDSEEQQINAKANNFPLLVHELIKGAMEYVSQVGLPRDPEKAEQVLASDELKDEAMDLGIGPALWKSISSLVDVNQRRYLLDVYQKIMELPIDESDELGREFVDTIRKLLAKGPEAESLIKSFIQEIETGIDDYERGDL